MMIEAARRSITCLKTWRVARRSLAAIGIEVWRRDRRGVELVEADRLLQPGDVVGFQRLGDAERRRQRPQAVQLDHDLHPVADGVRILLEQLEGLLRVPARKCACRWASAATSKGQIFIR
jgi:hypothetical protein